MIRTQALIYQYTDGPRLSFPDMEIKDASVIIGPSGAGKTTLLHLLGGILTPTEGKIWHDDINLANLSDRQLDRYRGRSVGIVFQQSHYLKAITVKENLQIIQKTGSGQKDDDHLNGLLHELDLFDQRNKYPLQLSQGQCQRLSIALALANKPTILLADEPTSSLDDANCDRVVNLLLSEAASHTNQLVIITHDQRVIRHFQKPIRL